MVIAVFYVSDNQSISLKYLPFSTSQYTHNYSQPPAGSV